MVAEGFLKVVERVEGSGFGGRDRALLKLFVDYLRGSGLSLARIRRYVESLIAFGRFTGWRGLEDVDADLMRRFVTWCHEKYKPWSRHTILSNIKAFYRWLFDGDERYEKVVGWIKIGLKPNERDIPRVILSPDEVNRMAAVTDNPRAVSYTHLTLPTN